MPITVVHHTKFKRVLPIGGGLDTNAWNEEHVVSGEESISNPPSGCHRITNIYVNADGKLVVEYDVGD